MSGLVKAKKYDWKDTNLAMFGSDTEKQVKKESAESEPAWEGAGQEEGLQIWRIVKFKVEEWPKEDYGKFFNGDSYIILNTYKKDPDSEALDYDVHFWIGRFSTQVNITSEETDFIVHYIKGFVEVLDEYGTAAYKTVELDTLLDDAAVQHREVENHESELFQSYFPSITVMTGGADSGFRHVTPEEYKPRLLQFRRAQKTVSVKEIPLSRERITSEDVFILDLGLQIYQFNGSNCDKDEKFKAMQYLQALKSERSGKPKVETLEESEVYDEHVFYTSLTEDDEDDEDVPDGEGPTTLLRVSDADGSLSMDNVKEGDVTQEDFVSEDVFILDTGKECFVWIGGTASPAEKKNGMSYAHKHLQGSDHPYSPVSIVREGREPNNFKTALAA